MQMSRWSVAIAVVAAIMTAMGTGTSFALGSARGAAVPGAPGDRIADAVLGQPDFTSIDCNHGGESAASLCEPMSVTAVTAAGRMYVADGSNSRVLGYPTASFANGASADVLLGQQSYTSTQKCGHPPSATTLCQLMGDTAIDSQGNVYVADRKNDRVLFFYDPATTDSIADNVFGQPDFTSNKCSNTDTSVMCWPFGVALDAQGHLYVSVQKSRRIFIYLDPLGSGFSPKPDIILGGGSGAANTRLEGCGDPPTASTFCENRGIAVDSQGTLWVADSGNSRILAFLDPIHTDGVADLVIGSPNFTTQQCDMGGITRSSLCEPRGVDVYQSPHGPVVWVIDTLDNRVLGYRDPFGTDTVADMVLGQPSFAVNVCNSTGIGPTSMCVPREGSVDADGNVYVADSYNNRVLRYDRPLG
jgi:NHL repeat